MISIVIPLFNEDVVLPRLWEILKCEQEAWAQSSEFIFVDDGSTDKTLQLLADIAQNNSNVTVLSLSRNFGHQAAICAGLKYSKGDAVILMDGDLQDPPEVISRFLEKWDQGFDVVYAIRKNRKESFLKRICYYVFYRFLHRLSELKIPVDAGDFCLMSRRVVDILNNMPEVGRFIRGMRAFAGFKQIGIEYEREERAAGIPKYTLKKLMQLALDGLFDFSKFPLRLSGYIGLIVALPSLFLGIFFLIQRIFDLKIFGYSPADVPGLASLAVGMFFLGGVNLLMLGVIGEYVGRIYSEAKQRPTYIVRDIIEGSQDNKID